MKNDEKKFSLNKKWGKSLTDEEKKNLEGGNGFSYLCTLTKFSCNACTVVACGGGGGPHSYV